MLTFYGSNKRPGSGLGCTAASVPTGRRDSRRGGKRCGIGFGARDPRVEPTLWLKVRFRRDEHSATKSSRWKGVEQVSYQELIDAGALLPPITHPDPAHCCVSGTGLTHLGSAGYP